MSNTVELTALARLRGDPRLEDLGSFVPPLRLFEALGVARDEVTHSRLLATLLNPRTHAGAEVMLRGLLARIAKDEKTPTNVVAWISGLPQEQSKISVQRELYRVDVIADIAAPNGLVVGIENKIDAGEGGDQLSRYQDFLRERFPRRRALMLFLTPTGRLPLTAAEKHTVPCIPISYADVLASITGARKNATERDAHTLDVVALHLREEIMGEPDPIRKAVRELWRDHPDALRLLVEHRPQLEDIRDAYEDGIRQELGKDVKFSYYPNRGERREIQFVLPVKPDVYPFTFMLHEDEGQLFTRLLIYRDEYDAKAKRLKKWATATNANKPRLIDEDFKPILRWSVWRRVFVEEDWPAHALLPVSDSDEETARAAVKRMLEFMDRLRPYLA